LLFPQMKSSLYLHYILAHVTPNYIDDNAIDLNYHATDRNEGWFAHAKKILRYQTNRQVENCLEKVFVKMNWGFCSENVENRKKFMEIFPNNYKFVKWYHLYPGANRNVELFLENLKKWGFQENVHWKKEITPMGNKKVLFFVEELKLK